MNTTAPTSGRHRWFGLGVLATGLSLIVIDGTIVGVSLPTIIEQLHLDITQAQWITSLYAVVFAALLLSAGWLGDRVGRRAVFIGGIAVFVTGSILAALADGGTALILARVVQGIGGAAVLPTSLSTVNATFRDDDRAAAFGVWGAVISGAAALGPLLGGWLTEAFGWRWIFWINVPLGVLVIVGALLVVTETRSGRREPGIDVDGLQLSAIGFGALVFAVIEGDQVGWFRPIAELRLPGFTWGTNMPISIVPVAFAVSALSLGLFVMWERHRARVGRTALLDLSLFGIPTFSFGNIAAMTIAAGEFALLFVLPLFLVNAVGLGALGAGVVLCTMALGAFVSGAAARHLAAAIGPARVVVVGLTLEVVAVLVLALLVHATTPAWLVALLLLPYGLGLGLASAQLTSTVLRDIPADLSGQGSATQSTVRQVGSAIGTAVAGSALAVALAQHLASLTGPAGRLAPAVRESVGGVLPVLRDQGDPHGVLAPLTTAFADATRAGLWAALAFLALGLICAVAVAVVAQKTPEEARSRM